MTDPNKLHKLKGEMDGYQAYSPEKVNELVEIYLSGANREKLKPEFRSSRAPLAIPTSAFGLNASSTPV